MEFLKSLEPEIAEALYEKRRELGRPLDVADVIAIFFAVVERECDRHEENCCPFCGG